MSDKLRCCFCQQELDIDPCGEMGCPNDKCKESAFLIGTKELWSAFITTRKALDVAVKRLEDIVLDAEILATPEYLASRAKETLEQINEITKGETNE